MSNLKFCPDINEIDNVIFRPYMIENAYDYYIISTTSTHQRMGIQTVLCALSIEIILKSFHVTVASNQGQPNETYKFNKKEALPPNANAHDLIVLYQALPVNIQKYLFDNAELEVLTESKDLFTKSRYAYEPEANVISDDDIIKLTACLICKMVFLYRELGCTDYFINNFDVNYLYFSKVQQFIWV
ncbi:hypothetical protein [Shewanella glacialipiscicola]|uniref:Uncharacterized protein n=2 Tax=Shewanella glacialipiscicola TaxID=614069 RepID=A0ABQ6J2Z3_9GAMM|nr:hypothetical protein [Shewanella glacialipiscicola]MCL1087676.1 hypothetical protein [Shewanella glacialipiscicola]GMA82094.1 hypothetical protein GCM10025855_16270 [Shewanella glacialipiscicola]